MANTSFSEIYDLSMVVIRDYKINLLFDPDDLTAFENFMLGYLKRAISKFTNCEKDIDNTDFSSDEFDVILSIKEQVILADLVVIEWLSSKILDVTQIQLHLDDASFKHYAESQNLTAKINTREILREVVSQDMTDYGFKNVPWSEWAGGNFFGTQ